MEVKAQFEDGRPMKQAEIKIFEPQDPEQPAFVGHTDDQGLYHFVPIMAEDWEIMVRKTGHGTQAVLPVQMDSNQRPQIAGYDLKNSGQSKFLFEIIMNSLINTSEERLEVPYLGRTEKYTIAR